MNGVKALTVNYLAMPRFQINDVEFSDILRYDDKCFVRPKSQIRKALLQKLIRIPGSSCVALDKEDVITGFGCRRVALGVNTHLIGPLYAESYEIAHDILRTLCSGIGSDSSVCITVL